MNKKITALICAITVMFSVTSVYASESDQIQPEAVESEIIPVTYTLSLDDAVKMATDGSSELLVCDINKQNFQKQYTDAVLMQKDYKYVPVHVNQNFEMMYVKKGYYVNMFKKYIELSDYERKKIESAIAYDTTEKYFTYKNAQALLNAAENGLERASENLSIIKQKYELGICSQLEVSNAEISKNECETNVTKSRQNVDLCKDNLKIRLNIEGDCEFILTDDISVSEFYSDLESDTQKALDSRYDVTALKITADLSQEYFSIASGLNENSVTYFSAYTDYIKNDNNYKTGVKNIRLAIKSAYYNALNAISDSQITKQRLDFLTNQYEVNKLQFEMGMITNFILSAKSDELTSAEIAYENALLKEKLAVSNYYYQITTGI